MKTKLVLWTLFILCSTLTADAQFETDYQPQQCSGMLPADFVQPASSKYKSEAKALRKEKGKQKKVKNKFLLDSNYETDNMLKGGRVLVNDPLSVYIGHVADQVLASDMETRRKLRFYVLRTTYVNATATNQGVIFINMGLLAQVENEAQLAYILCHEITHWKKKHAINRALERDKIERGENAYKNFSKDEQFLASRSFSREQEAQADLEGYELFKKSGYRIDHLIGIYDVLKYSRLAFDDVPFDPSFLETPAYRIPVSFILKETTPISTDDKAPNLKSTHPSIRERREVIFDKIVKDYVAGKSDYLVSKEQFENARTMARFELSRLYLLQHKYEDAIYNSYLLLRKYPNNLYLKKNIMESLEGLASYAASSDFSSAHTSYLGVEGGQQTLNYMIGKMDSVSPKDVIILALSYAVRLKAQYPSDIDIEEHTRFILRMLSRQEVKMDYFASEVPTGPLPSLRDTTGGATFSDSTEQSKYDKIRERERLKAEAQRIYYTRYALVGHTGDKWLKDMYDETYRTRSSEFEADHVSFARRKRVSEREYALGVDRILIVDPFYARVEVDGEKESRHLKAEAGRKKFKKYLKQCARAAKLDIEVLDSRTLKDGDADKLNDISILEEYNTERLLRQNVAGIYPERSRISAVAQKYNADYLMWTGVTSYREDDARVAVLAGLTSAFPIILPITIIKMVNGGQYTLIYNMVYDVKNDVLTMANYREVNARTSQNVLNSNLYDIMSQIHRKPAVAKEKPKH